MSQNRQIAKNSLILYAKLIITTIIGLYTTRLVLSELGADDYGLYAVVGGIVSVMGLISTAMIATTYRFVSVELGKGDLGNVNKVFNTSLIIHIVLSLLFLLIAETLGLWYIKNYLNVPQGKISDAIFVLHFVVISTVVSIVAIPYQGLLTAKENFIVRASIEVFRSALRLILVVLLTYYLGNKLRGYAILMAIVMLMPAIIFYFYCQIKERANVKFNINRNFQDYKEIFGFTGWILIGTVAHMGVRQGAAIVINLFFGTLLNAAFGIATQVYNYIMMFVKNLNQAAVPQIMKSHASGDSERSLTLVYNVSRYAFLIMLFPAIPIVLSLDSILIIWLKNVPEYTQQFIFLMIVNGLIGVTSSGFDAAIQATGRIRKTQIWYSITMLSTLPIAYILFKLEFPPYTIVILNIVATIVNLIIQMNILATLTEFKVVLFLKKTIVPALFVIVLLLPLYYLRTFFGQNLVDIITFSLISLILTATIIYFAGISASEKKIIRLQLMKLKNKII